MRHRLPRASAVVCGLLVAACSDTGQDRSTLQEPTSSLASASQGVTSPSSMTSPTTSGISVTGASTTTGTSVAEDGSLRVVVDVGQPIGTISPLIRGLSSAPSAEYLQQVGATLNSWGGNPATRYNFELGNAWNNGRDWEYRNTNYGLTGDVAAGFLAEAEGANIATRLAIPTLGWVARDDDTTTCSFPDGAGGCGTADGADCQHQGLVADPNAANVPSTPAGVQAWLRELIVEQGHRVDFIAMDNEPELWGFTHYDVHPECTTYEEILDHYLTYANAAREVAPDAALLGPVTCCWFSYWNTAPGPASGGSDPFVEWFLDQVRHHDEAGGARTLDVLDVHYYPQSNVFNDDTDSETAARRLRSVRSLYDSDYADESWIGEPIWFIPRMLETIENHYPGTRLGITEWNFGADRSMNGALAIADALGIFGREGVFLASYWQYPEPGSPGSFAFAIHGNYDGAGSSFSGIALPATSPDVDVLASFAALDPDSGHLKVMLINKQLDQNLTVRLELTGFAATTGTLWRYSSAEPNEIVREDTGSGSTLEVRLPAYSITLVDLSP